jgi:predicted AAA+ superfamily ATPase
MIPRRIQQNAQDALSDTPVVLINGARQTGKSTLAQKIQPGCRYLTLDDSAVLTAAQADPFGFINAMDDPVCLDEVQRAPEIFLAIKAAVDKHRTPGRFLLTGSANALLLPQLADSLAGRMEVLELWPLAQTEIERNSHSLVDDLFSGNFADSYPFSRNDFIIRLIRGGYPVALQRNNDKRRAAWFDNYLTTILQRDVQDLARIEGLSELPNLLRLLATRSGSLLNIAELSRTTRIAQTTLQRYLTLLQTLFLVRLVPAWFSNLGKRIQKTPKVFISDYGLIAHLQGYDTAYLQAELGLPGDLVESFVFAELCKHQSWAEQSTLLMHYRTSTGVEVDFILENKRKELVGIEVKAATTVVNKDLNGLRHLRETVPQQFKRGILLYTGEQVIHFDESLVAVPISLFWSTSP